MVSASTLQPLASSITRLVIFVTVNERPRGVSTPQPLAWSITRVVICNCK